MRRQEGIHEGLEVGSVPLRDGVGDGPLAICCGGGFAEGTCRSEALVQALFEAFDLVDVVAEVVAGSTSVRRQHVRLLHYCNRKTEVEVEMVSQLEEGIGNLQHQHVRVVVLVANQDALTRPPHAMFAIVLFQSSQSVLDGWIFLRLCFLRAECVVAEWI